MFYSYRKAYADFVFKVYCRLTCLNFGSWTINYKKLKITDYDPDYPKELLNKNRAAMCIANHTGIIDTFAMTAFYHTSYLSNY